MMTRIHDATLQHVSKTSLTSWDILFEIFRRLHLCCWTQWLKIRKKVQFMEATQHNKQRARKFKKVHTKNSRELTVSA